MVNSAKKIFQEEGIRGFYRGLTPSLLTIPMFGGIYWASYDFLKRELEIKMPTWPVEFIHLVSAVGAGAIGIITIIIMLIIS